MHAIKSRIGPLLRLVAEVGQRGKVTITPNHFYSEFPDIASLRREMYWRGPMSMAGVSGTGTGEQLAFVRSCCEGYGAELGRGEIHARAVERNGEMGFGAIEAEFLYCYVRSRRPRKIVQVGCGVSTAVILQAAGDEGYTPEVVCIEPYAGRFLRGEHGAGRIRLVEEMAQKVALEELTSVGAGDLLFVDSTHTVKIGSEVVRIILEVMPRLERGAEVHFHDIMFPHDYTPGVLKHELFFNRETVLLQAFLAMNPAYTIRASLSMLHHAEGAGLRGIFPTYRPCRIENAELVEAGHFPSSTYLARVG